MHWTARGVTGGLRGRDLQINAQRLEVNLGCGEVWHHVSNLIQEVKAAYLRPGGNLISILIWSFLCWVFSIKSTNRHVGWISVLNGGLAWKEICYSEADLSYKLDFCLWCKLNLWRNSTQWCKTTTKKSSLVRCMSQRKGKQRLSRHRLGNKKCMWINFK